MSGSDTISIKPLPALFRSTFDVCDCVSDVVLAVSCLEFRYFSPSGINVLYLLKLDLFYSDYRTICRKMYEASCCKRRWGKDELTNYVC